MKTKENIINILEKNSIKSRLKYIFYKTNPCGISLIVLVITIIVIIILATAIIVNIVGNNPISEANRARFESDRDSMQSVFTNTVAKVMAKNQSSINIKEGQINNVVEGVNETIGEVIYELENPEKSENKNGKIIFDNKENKEVEYYTGRKLPIYKAGKTIWSVDSAGILKLNVGGKDFDESEGSSGSMGDEIDKEENISISKEEYENLKASVAEIKSVQDIMKSQQEDFNISLEQISKKVNVGQIRAGQVNISTLPSGSFKEVQVIFKEAMPDTNYSP